MPKAPVISDEEKEAILEVTAELKTKNEEISTRDIGKVVDRSKEIVLKVMSDKKYEVYKARYRKKIDSQRMGIIEMADEQLRDLMKKKQIKAYQLIGLSKVFHEQVYPQNIPMFGGDNSTVNVQVVRGGVSYNTDNKKPEAK